MQEFITLTIADKFYFRVAEDGLGAAEDIDLHGMVDNEIDRHRRIDFLWIAAHALHRAAERSQVDQRGYTGEILQDDTRRAKGDLNRPGILRVPRRQILHIFGLKVALVLIAQGVFQQDLDAEGQPLDLANASLAQYAQAVDRRFSATGVDGAACPESVAHLPVLLRRRHRAVNMLTPSDNYCRYAE